MKIPRLFACGLLAVSVLATPLFLSGCSKSRSATGGSSVVRGKVTYKGENITTGVVEFWNQDGPVGHGPINRDGTYEATGLAEGNYQVCVVTSPKMSAQAMQKFGPSAEGKPGVPPAGSGGPPGIPGRPGGPPGVGGPPAVSGPPGVGGPPGVVGGKPPDRGGKPEDGSGGPVRPPRVGEAPPLPPGAPPPDFTLPSKENLPGGLPGGAPDPLDRLPKEKRQLHEEAQRKYGTIMVSKITVAVQSGEQTFDLNLD
jgi:hypothetical protein